MHVMGERPADEVRACGRLAGRVALLAGAATTPVAAAVIDRLQVEGADVAADPGTAAVSDLSQLATWAQLVTDVVATNGWLDLAVWITSPDVDQPQAWAEVMRTQRSAFLFCQATAEALIAAPDGAIVVVTATGDGAAADPAVDAARGGLLSLIRALAVELGPRGVRANAVSAGAVDAAAVASAAAFLASPDASYTTGQALVVDGGREP